MSIFIIGAGMGDKKTLTREAEEKIEIADIIIGAKRTVQNYAQSGKKVFFEYAPEKTAEILENSEYKNAAVLFSGDASFYSGAKKILKLFPEAEVCAGISCVSYFCAKIAMPYDDMNIVSMHGRDCNIVSEVRAHKKTFALLGKNPCAKLCRYGLGSVSVYIGENLSYENERVRSGTAEDFAEEEFDALSVIVIINNNYDDRVKIGIADEEFVRGDCPMTKREVRAVSVAYLEAAPGDIIADIGAGTGSVSIEAARLCPKGRVYAVEKDAAAAEIIEKNAVKFMTDNVEVICGEAPSAVYGLKFDKAFIGGSSGKLEEIIEACGCGRIIVNAVTFETLEKAKNVFERLGYSYSVTQISASRAKKVGEYNMIKAQNPVFIIAGDKL